MTSAIAFDNSYARLPEEFYSLQAPTPVSDPQLIRVNDALAEVLGIDNQWLRSAQGLDILAGNRVPSGSQPIATAYAGHQFGGWNPQLGDGRAVLLGEVIGRNNQRYDLQLKGSGRTQWSRGGDGRSPLGPVLREYLISEAMHAMGVPTTRSLAAVSTGETVIREEILPGAILCRVAHSHIRIGTFQYFAARRDIEALGTLVQYVIDRHYSSASASANPVLSLLEQVIEAQLRLVSQWQLLGFIHGVMNTDNMLLSGETVDYGPCAFMDAYDPATVFSSIDHAGRYQYQNQPGIAHWNLAQFAQCLIPLLAEDQEQAVALAQDAIDQIPGKYNKRYQQGLCDKLALAEHRNDDTPLIDDLFNIMATQKLDFTLCFRYLSSQVEPDRPADKSLAAYFTAPQALQAWVQRWLDRVALEPEHARQRYARMRAVNPALIPRNHQVELAIEQATMHQDFSLFHRLVDAWETPYEITEGNLDLAAPPAPGEEVKQTFCGT